MEEAKDECDRNELEMQALDLDLDRQDEMEDDGASFVQQMDDLKLRKYYSNWLFSLPCVLFKQA